MTKEKSREVQEHYVLVPEEYTHGQELCSSIERCVNKLIKNDFPRVFLYYVWYRDTTYLIISGKCVGKESDKEKIAQEFVLERE